MKNKTKVLMTAEEAQRYENQWVAFSDDLQRIVGHGSTPEDALAMAALHQEPHAFLHYVGSWGRPAIHV